MLYITSRRAYSAGIESTDWKDGDPHPILATRDIIGIRVDGFEKESMEIFFPFLKSQVPSVRFYGDFARTIYVNLVAID